MRDLKTYWVLCERTGESAMKINAVSPQNAINTWMQNYDTGDFSVADGDQFDMKVREPNWASWDEYTVTCSITTTYEVKKL